MLRAHHASAYRYLSRRYPGLRFAPLRLRLSPVHPIAVGAEPLGPHVADVDGGAAASEGADVVEDVFAVKALA